MELIFEFIPPRLLAFVLCLGILAGGVYIWRGGGEERALFDAATGAESKTVTAEIRRKTVRSESTSGINDHDSGTANVNYLVLMYEENGKYEAVDARIDPDEYDRAQVGDTIKISFHPANPNYDVTPAKTRPWVIWYRIGGGTLILLGAILMLMILVSLF